MTKPKLIRITTVPISLEKLLVGQLTYMQRCFDVTAISADEKRLSELGKKNKYDTFHIEMTREITPWQDFKALVKLYRHLKIKKPTIVHTHTPKAGIVGMLAAKMAGVPFRLHTVAGLPLMESTGFKRRILNGVEKLTYASATRVYPNSKGLYDFIIEEKLSSSHKMKIIGNGSSNGINTTHFDPAALMKADLEKLRDEVGIQEGDFVFVFVGRLVGDKGVNELLLAFQDICESGSKVKLLLVGIFEKDLDPLTLESERILETNKNIICVGYQKDVRPYFAISNALAFPSYREGFPNVVMQAGAMGLPSIVSNINGCNEIISDGENGLIVPSKNVESLLNSMRRLISDRALYEKLTFNARPMIVNRYEQSMVWEALLKEYKNLIRC